jgi:hypothetical protein
VGLGDQGLAGLAPALAVAKDEFDDRCYIVVRRRKGKRRTTTGPRARSGRNRVRITELAALQKDAAMFGACVS